MNCLSSLLRVARVLIVRFREEEFEIAVIHFCCIAANWQTQGDFVVTKCQGSHREQKFSAILHGAAERAHNLCDDGLCAALNLFCL